MGISSGSSGISGIQRGMGGRNGTSVDGDQRAGRHCARSAMQGFRSGARGYFGHDVRGDGRTCAQPPFGVDHVGDGDTRDRGSIRLSDRDRDRRGRRSNLGVHDRRA
jgi:hypothetical protein